jgi:hypothetical protein
VIALAPFAAVLLAAAASGDGAPVGEGAPRRGLVVEAPGQCPGQEAVLAALYPVLGDEVMRSTHGAARVSDLGDHFEVVALGQTRQYSDAARDCAERARVAAVFITLAINPPMFAMPPPPRIVEVKPRPPEPIVAPSPSPSPSTWVRLGIGLRIDGGAGGDLDGVTPWGGEGRIAIGRGAFGAQVTGGVLGPIEGRLSSVVVHEQRFPSSMGVVGRRVFPRVEGALSIGLALVPFTLRADGLATSHQERRLDAGARIGLEVRVLRVPLMSPFAGLHAEYFPRSYAIDVDPLGNIGSTGHLWVGAVVGIALAPGDDRVQPFDAEPSDRR